MLARARHVCVYVCVCRGRGGGTYVPVHTPLVANPGTRPQRGRQRNHWRRWRCVRGAVLCAGVRRRASFAPRVPLAPLCAILLRAVGGARGAGGAQGYRLVKTTPAAGRHWAANVAGSSKTKQDLVVALHALGTYMRDDGGHQLYTLQDLRRARVSACAHSVL